LLRASAAGAQTYDVYQTLSDWNSIATAKTGVTAGLASSYDRAGDNDDFNQYESPLGLQTGTFPTVVKTLTGPGVITRFWMPHATADVGFTVKMTVDGEVRIDTNSDALLGGNYGYMQGPLVSTQTGGQVCYEPIAFQNSLTIESNNSAEGFWAGEHHYYQYSYHLLAPGTTVTPYSGTLTAQQQTDRADATAMIANVGANPAGENPAAIVVQQGAQEIAPGESLRLGRAFGSGQVRRLNVKMAGASDAALDGLRVRARFDGLSSYSIDVPVSQFFGAGHERAPYKSLPLGTDGNDGFYCYWPMPYRQEAVIELYNASGSPISIDSGAMEYESRPVGQEECIFHAVYNEQTTTAGQRSYRLLNVAGAGQYVGNMMYVKKAGTYMGILESDDIITVDGATTLYGTGMEDAYNGGYYYNHVLAQSDEGDVPYPDHGGGPYSGLLHMDGSHFGDNFVRTDQYRWLIPDCVPFTQSIEVLSENFLNDPNVLFGSTAFYYRAGLQAPIGGDATGDRQVAFEDLAILSANWQAAGEMTWVDCDFSGDGVVGFADLSVLAANWGQQFDPAPPVPEPATMAVLALAATWAAGRRPSTSSGRRRATRGLAR
jgi:hypothetical protein